MKGRDGERRRGEPGEPLGDPDLLELALDARGEPAAGRGKPLSPEESARLLELRAFVQHLRGVIAAGDVLEGGAGGAAADARARELAARVLARTTREDLSRWGDLALAGRFLAARLRASGALRLAAASLLLHLLALPVVAWVVLSSPSPQPRLWFAPHAPPELPFEEPGLEPDPLVTPEPLDQAALLEQTLAAEALLEHGGAAPYVENSLRWARFVLRSAPGPELPAPAGPEGELARLLRARAERLAGAAPDRHLLAELAAEVAGEPAAAPRDGALAALRAELLLDELLLSGSAPDALAPALAALQPLDPPPASPQEAAAARLEASALARAEAYGVLSGEGRALLREAREQLAGAERLLGPGKEAWQVAPLDPEWCRLLALAAGDRLPETLARDLAGR